MHSRQKRALLAGFGAPVVAVTVAATAWGCAVVGSPYLADVVPSRVTVGQTVTVAGGNWSAGDVSLRYLAGDTSLGTATAVAGGGGSFSVRLSVPDQAGTYAVEAAQGSAVSARKLIEVVGVGGPPASTGGDQPTNANGVTSAQVSGRMTPAAPSGPVVVEVLPDPSASQSADDPAAPEPVASDASLDNGFVLQPGPEPAPVQPTDVAPGERGSAILAPVPSAEDATGQNALVLTQPVTSTVGESSVVQATEEPAGGAAVPAGVASLSQSAGASAVPGLEGSTVTRTSGSSDSAIVGVWLAVGIIPLLGAIALMGLRRRAAASS